MTKKLFLPWHVIATVGVGYRKPGQVLSTHTTEAKAHQRAKQFGLSFCRVSKNTSITKAGEDGHDRSG